MQCYKVLLIRVCLPMLMFALPDVLFKFQYHAPAFVVLFQFPPTMASTHPVSLYCSL